MIRAVNGFDASEPTFEAALAELDFAEDRLRRMVRVARHTLEIRDLAHALRDPDKPGLQALRATADGLMRDAAEVLDVFAARRDARAADFERALQRVGGAAAA